MTSIYIYCTKTVVKLKSLAYSKIDNEESIDTTAVEINLWDTNYMKS